MGTINGGYYFNVLYLTFDSKKKMVDKEIEGPIPVCREVFQNRGDCVYINEKDIEEAGPLVPHRFHNKDVHPHPQVEAIYSQEWVPKMAEQL